jgi:CCR4-NOT complex subunit CAF16
MKAIDVRGLTFRYPGAAAPVFAGLSFQVDAGARCLLLGANGVGKTTLLRLIAGRHMIAPEVIRVLGRPAFEDTTLAAEVALLGGPFPFSADISVREILGSRPGIEPARRDRLLAVLDVDPTWRMHRVSDGQRRRVQILLDLVCAPRVILLDEVTAELDVLARADLLELLRGESADGATIVYASHVLDGLEEFATHVAFLSPGRMRVMAPIGEIPDRRGSSLRALCEAWMREDRNTRSQTPTT